MTLLPNPRATAVVAACGVLAALGAGCALRATTDFGPQSESSTRSISMGREDLPVVSGVSGPNGNSVGLRDAGGHDGNAGSAGSADGTR